MTLPMTLQASSIGPWERTQDRDVAEKRDNVGKIGGIEFQKE